MSEYVIEKCVPISRKMWGSRPRNYPFGEMEVGDSFFVRDGSIYDAGERARRDQPKMKFLTRSVEGGIRVWRVA